MVKKFDITIKAELVRRLTQFDGLHRHPYLDRKGHLFVGVGYRLRNRGAMLALPFFKNILGSATRAASDEEITAEYQRIQALPHGSSYPAHWYAQHCDLLLKHKDIKRLLSKHIFKSYCQLVEIYSNHNGYRVAFDDMPRKVKLALFDMFFSLGSARLVGEYGRFNDALKRSDWFEAGKLANRFGVPLKRNAYVKSLLYMAH